MTKLLRYLAFGSDELTMPKDWLENKERMAEYDAWTKRQRESYVVQDAAAMRRKAFWQAREQCPSEK